jgi:RNA polymerase sigma-70 factor (ECF subfamily)
MARTASVDDVMQEILLAAWQSLASFRGDVGLRAWVLGIARHKVDDHYRKLIREANIQEEEDSGTDVPATAAGPEKQLELAAEQDRVHRTLALLPDAYVAALLWRYRDERSTRDIAQDTGKTEKAIERLLARAREGFRKRWNDARA